MAYDSKQLVAVILEELIREPVFLGDQPNEQAKWDFALHCQTRVPNVYIKTVNSRVEIVKKLVQASFFHGMGNPIQNDNPYKYIVENANLSQLFTAAREKFTRMNEPKDAWLKENLVVCNICFEVMHQATSLMPCLHKFCHLCARRWLARTMNCPCCRNAVHSSGKDAQFNEIVDAFYNDHPDKRRDAAAIAEIEAEERRLDDAERQRGPRRGQNWIHWQQALRGIPGMQIVNYSDSDSSSEEFSDMEDDAASDGSGSGDEIDGAMGALRRRDTPMPEEDDDGASDDEIPEIMGSTITDDSREDDDQMDVTDVILDDIDEMENFVARMRFPPNGMFAMMNGADDDNDDE